MPLTVDLVNLHPFDRSVVWAFSATVDLRRGEPRLVRMVVEGPGGLNPVHLQREFRWASPLEVVRRAVPALLQRGIDPFTYEFPEQGYPKAADLDADSGWRLTDVFLEEISRRYLELGRGYARTIAWERAVTPRTVVSWVEKARRRGILSRAKPGTHGGHIIPADQRHCAPAARQRPGQGAPCDPLLTAETPTPLDGAAGGEVRLGRSVTESPATAPIIVDGERDDVIAQDESVDLRRPLSMT